jgi:hypothetical protein
MQDLKEMLHGNSIRENVVFVYYILICQKLGGKLHALTAFLPGEIASMYVG